MISALLQALGAVLSAARTLTPTRQAAPLLAYRKAHGGWYCSYRQGPQAFGLTKRDAAMAALRQAGLMANGPK